MSGLPATEVGVLALVIYVLTKDVIVPLVKKVVKNHRRTVDDPAPSENPGKALGELALSVGRCQAASVERGLSTGRTLDALLNTQKEVLMSVQNLRERVAVLEDGKRP